MPVAMLQQRNIDFYNIKDKGAQCDGVTDDTTAVRAAITAASNAGGGAVYHPGGTCITQKLTLPTGVWLVGAGYEASIYKLKNGVNDNLIETTNFSTLTGTNTVAAPYNFGITNLTLDGNKANQTTGYGVAIYGYGYSLQNARIRNCKSWGIWSEWATQSTSPGNDSMEAFITDFKVHDCDGGGMRLQGPHDSQWNNGIIYKNGTGTGSIAIYIPVDGYANGSTLQQLHIWGGTYDYGIQNNSSGILIADSQCEGALLAQIYENASINQIEGCKLFAGGVNGSTVKGLLIGSGINNIKGNFKVENCGGAVVDLTGSGGDHHLTIAATYYNGATAPNPAIVGSIDANSFISLNVIKNDGTATSDSIIQHPVKIKAPTINASSSFTGPDINITGFPSKQLAGLMSSNRQESLLRPMASTNSTISSGFILFAYFTCDFAINAANIASACAGTLASGLTFAKMGLYTVDGSNNLTCVARTAS